MVFPIHLVTTTRQPGVVPFAISWPDVVETFGHLLVKCQVLVRIASRCCGDRLLVRISASQAAVQP